MQSEAMRQYPFEVTYETSTGEATYIIMATDEADARRCFESLYMALVLKVKAIQDCR